MLVVLYTTVAMLSTLGGGLLALRARHRGSLLLGFGAGVLLAAVFFDLLPESAEAAARHGWSIRPVLALAALGFLGFLLFERVLVLHACPEEDCHNHAHRTVGRAAAVALIGHSTLDGFSIGAATLLDWRTGLLVALAVVAHDAADGLNTVLLLTHGERARRGDLLFLAADALAPVAGGLLALSLHPSAVLLAVFLALASGFFLHTATSDLLPEAHRRSSGWGVTAATLAGLAIVVTAVELLRG